MIPLSRSSNDFASEWVRSVFTSINKDMRAEELDTQDDLRKSDSISDGIPGFPDDDDQEILSCNDLTAYLTRLGFRADDPRLESIYKSLNDTCHLDILTFRELVCSNELLERALRNELAVTNYPRLEHETLGIFNDLKLINEGSVASYIPSLSRVDPSLFGFSFCSVNGQRLSHGDSQSTFSVQSVSKAITYCLALELNGSKAVHEKVGMEPSGKKFSERLLKKPQNIPHNPFLNAGAMMCASFVHMSSPSWERIEIVLDIWRRLSGSKTAPHIQASTLAAERSTSYGNVCLLHMMAESGLFGPNPTAAYLNDILDAYLQYCSIELDCERLAVVAATLANGGVNPLTNDRVFSGETVSDVLTLMMSCGMYDSSGKFAFHCGFPAKSGVSGAIMAVIPGVGGFAVYSPCLDDYGNSARGVAFCRELARIIPEVHAFHSKKKIVDSPYLMRTSSPQRWNSTDSPRNSGSIDLLPDIFADNYRWRTSTHNMSIGLRERSSLWWAASECDLMRIRQLASRGMSMLDADYKGRRALDIARENLLTRIVPTSYACVELLSKLVDVELAEQMSAEPRAAVPGYPDGIPYSSSSCSLAAIISEGHLTLHKYFTGRVPDKNLIMNELASYGVLAKDSWLEFLDDTANVHPLVSKALCGKLSIPNWKAFTSVLDQLAVTYSFSLETVTAQKYVSKSNSDDSVLLGSLVKPFIYAAAVELLGVEAVHRWVGEEPSGEPEDSLALQSGSLIPYNPFMTSGCLVLCALLLNEVEDGYEDVIGRIESILSRLSFSDVKIHRPSLPIEVCPRLACIAFMLKSENCLPDSVDVGSIISLYQVLNLSQLSISTLSSVASGLAAGSCHVSQSVLNLMLACGCNERSGEWAFTVGLPAKMSDFGILIVVPNIMGICASRKPDDDKDFFQLGAQIEKHFNFHLFRKHEIFSCNKKIHSDPTLYFGDNRRELITRLLLAATKGDVNTLAALINTGVDVNWVDYDGRTALHQALAGGHIEAATWLINMGANVDLRDRWGYTAREVVSEADKDTIEGLLKMNVKV